MLKSTQIIIAKSRKPLTLTAAVTCLLLLSTQAGASPVALNEPVLQQVYQQYGEQAQVRLQQWQQTLNRAIGKTEIEQLELANNFINQAKFIDSPYYQDGLDFKLSPIEFLILGVGDSQEFSIAKYFTLRQMGVPSRKLRLTYTEIQSNNAPHMVLAYYNAADAEPLVLDYLDKAVRPLSQRQDIRPIYSFDAEHIWLTQSNLKIRHSQQPTHLLHGPDKPAAFLAQPATTIVSTHY